MDDCDYEIEDEACPRCEQYTVRSRNCDEWNCDDGYIDEYENDPINYSPGEEYAMCQECYGTGIVVWCSNCGLDITLHEFKKREAKDAR